VTLKENRQDLDWFLNQSINEPVINNFLGMPSALCYLPGMLPAAQTSLTVQQRTQMLTWDQINPPALKDLLY
jgi:hypothetical protein